VFDGGAGNDTLFVGTGQDTILFGRGAGLDSLTLDTNVGDLDLIQIAPDVSPNDVLLTRSVQRATGTNLIDLTIPTTGDRLTVNVSYVGIGSETAPQAAVLFADGTRWDLLWAPVAPVSSGPDVLEAAFPATVAGLGGDDTYLFGSSGIPGSYAALEAPGEGIDTVQNLFDYTLDPHVENLILAESTSAVRGTGNELDNLIIGNTGDNILEGGAGNDVLVGGLFRAYEVGVSTTGSDILIGGPGNDVFMADGGNFAFYSISGFEGGEWRDDVVRHADDLFIGGIGNDTYIVHSQEQTLAEFENEGTDTVRSTVSYVLGAHLENLELESQIVFDEEGNIVSSPPLNGTGNELDNVLIGSENANILSGLAGRDTLVGRLGNDTLRGGTGHDSYVFNLGDGIDTIDDAAAAGEGNRIQFGAGIAQADLALTHDEIARTLTIQVGDTGTDQLILTNFDPAGANGSLVIETLAFADGSEVSLASLFGPTVTDGDDVITTGPADDVIEALGGNDVVNAGAGDDMIAGGSGNDTLIGGSGNDTYSYQLGDGVDTINDTAGPGEGNTLAFGPGIGSTDLSLGVGSLLIRVGTTGGAIHLTPFDPNDALGAHAIDTFRFADGTTLTYSQLLDRGFDLTGTAGNDTIVGTNVVDRISGLAGDDVLDGRAGSDTLIGGPGNDTYVVDDAGDVVTELADEGADAVLAAVSYQLSENVEALTLTGTALIDGAGNALNNVLTGNSGNNVLDGGAGADLLIGGEGDDTFLISVDGTWTSGFVAKNSGSPGSAGTGQAVTLNGKNRSFDVSQGDAGLDRILGTAGDDALALDDQVSPFPSAVGPRIAGVEVIDVGDGNDVVDLTSALYSYGDVTLLGGNGDDTLWANTGNDILQGGAGNDNLYGGAGTDQLLGGDGNDTLDGDGGSDTLIGGLGHDTYVVDDLADAVTENANEGTDTVRSSMTYTLGANVENLTLTGTAAIDGTGNSANNTLTGNGAANVLAGSLGDDVYVVGAGDTVLENVNEGVDTIQSAVTWTLDDHVERLTLTGSAAVNAIGNALGNTLTGNSAANVLVGGAGDDLYVVGAGDTVVEQPNEGTDTVQSAVTWFLSDEVEHLTLTGSGAINGTGNALNNSLTGNSAANTLSGDGGDDQLNGGTGADTLIGGTGNDTYSVDNAGDVVTEQLDEGIDTVRSNLSWVLGDHIENLILTGSGAINGTGNALNNTITGNAAANVLDGGAGGDTAIGGKGNDTYVVDEAGDVVTEQPSEGTDTVQSSVSYILSANVEHLTLTGANAINGTGNALNNTLTGNSAANVLTGGAGNDTYVVSADDTVIENANEGTDLVQSDVAWTLDANLENLTLIGASAVNGTGNTLNNVLTGNGAANVLTGGAGNDTYVVSADDTVIENANEGTDTVQSDVTWTLGAHLEHLTLTGVAAIDATGNTLNNTLTGNSGSNQLAGGPGNDTLRGGLGNDTYLFNRGDGQDTVFENDATAGNNDRLLWGNTINPLDLVLSRQVNDLRIALHGTTERVTIQNWYGSPTTAQVEDIQANGQHLLNTQVDQLIQAMASFSQQTGLTWDQGIEQRPQEVQAVLAASWH
jgi:trimeric autotransporter adhesin